jgi:nicotinamide-nucleotide amidase
VAITGIAGPDGGSADKPVGLVWFALAQRSAPPLAIEQRYSGDREAIRRACVATALRLVIGAADPGRVALGRAADRSRGASARCGRRTSPGAG